MQTVNLTGETLTIDDVVAVARHGARVALPDPAATRRMQASRDWLEKQLGEQAVVYGVNTGFGPLASTTISPQETRALSRNVILACLVGVGPPLPREVVRAMMLIRANTFVRGHSGVRPILVQTLIDMLDRGVTPYVPQKGSLGASGDLAPLAHIAVVFTRDPDDREGHSGQAWFEGQLLSGAEAMKRAGLTSIVLEAKEGLALTNGTNLMVAMAALGLADARALLRQAEIAAALSFEALLGLSQSLHPALHEASRQPGQVQCAAHLRRLLEGSRLVDSQPQRVQDPYSLRCIPQVLGPIHDVLDFLEMRVADALNASIDNPLILPGVNDEGAAVISGGNFHGQGPALWLDYLASALSIIGNIAERRVFRLLTAELSNGLPAMLTPRSGLNSGMMMLQYTAAALVSDNKTLAHPDTSDSIPSSANQEDHVSMGANAARHMWEILQNVRHIVTIELLAAAQGVDLRDEGPQRLAMPTRRVHQLLRSVVPPLTRDREFTADMAAVVDLLATRQILDATGISP